MKRILLSLLLLPLFAWGQQPNINKVEYFFDTDPGFGSGINVPVAVADTTLSNISFAPNVSGLSDGFHTLHVRTRDANGTWSITAYRNFYKSAVPSNVASRPNIDKVEYFVDTDPGFGNGINVPVTAADTTLSNISFAPNVSGLSAGFHTLYVRSRDANGNWSVPSFRNFYKAAAPVLVASRPNIDKIEYFIDRDLGFGNGINVPIAAADTTLSNISFVPDVSALATGFHTLYTRSRDVNGDWSVTDARTFYKAPAPTNIASKPNIDKIEYFVDTDPGLGNGIHVSVPADTTLSNFNFSPDISALGLATGFHTLYVRSHDANGFWSETSYRTFYKAALPTNVAQRPLLERIEYFVDTDPGVGNATQMTIAQDTAVSNISFGVDVSGLTAGFHFLSKKKFGKNRYLLRLA